MDSDVTISAELAGEVEQLLSLAIGMAIIHAPDSHARLIGAATRLSDAINGADDD